MVLLAFICLRRRSVRTNLRGHGARVLQHGCSAILQGGDRLCWACVVVVVESVFVFWCSASLLRPGPVMRVAGTSTSLCVCTIGFGVQVLRSLLWEYSGVSDKSHTALCRRVCLLLNHGTRSTSTTRIWPTEILKTMVGLSADGASIMGTQRGGGGGLVPPLFTGRLFFRECCWWLGTHHIASALEKHASSGPVELVRRSLRTSH